MSDYSTLVAAHANLRNYWKLEEASGLMTDVESGVIATPGAGVGRGVLGRIAGDLAQRFRRDVTASTATINAAPAALSGAHTIEFLANFVLTPVTNGATQYIFGTRGSGSGFSTEMNVEPSATSGKLALRINLGNGAAWYQPAGVGAFDPGWRHVVLRVSAVGAWEILVDGVSIGSGAWGLAGSPLLFDATHNLTIGNYSRGYDANWMFEGRLQHFAIYNIWLPDADIAAHVAELPSEAPAYTIRKRPDPVAVRRTVRILMRSGFQGAGTGSMRPASGQMWPRLG